MINEQNTARDRAEIKITSEMKAAGAALIDEYYGVFDAAYLAERVYIAMAEILSFQTQHQDLL